jgi:N6-adenosine-specific RNA methylase IME4
MIHEVRLLGEEESPVANVLARIPNVERLVAKLERAEEPQEVMAIGAAAAGVEEIIQNAGFGKDREMLRPFRELWIDARWKLGRMLAQMVRVQGQRNDFVPPRDKVAGIRNELNRLGIDKNRATEAQRLGTLPLGEKAKAYQDARAAAELPTVSELVWLARPYWYQAQRKAKHQAIHDGAVAIDAELGPFPLIYADPPWRFEIYSEKGAERTPDQKYPTLSKEEIADFKVQHKLIRDIAYQDAALLLWCTSSNQHHALEIMSVWGFEFKASATWVKTKEDGITPITGLGLVFRNAHEILLYGTRGDMPGPQYQPPSVFLYPRGEHSAKPPEIRTEIEKMYPDFDAKTRLELFARETVEGWTPYGFEVYRANES